MSVRGAQALERGQELFGQGRYAEAAQVLLRGVGEEVRRGERPGEEGKRLLRSAAVAFARAGEPGKAAALYARLDERERAADLLRRAGRRSDALTVLQGGNVHDDPLRRDTPSEPSTTRLRVPTTPEEALALLMTRTAQEPGYPEAARRAAELAWQHDVLTFELDHWLGPWVRGGMLHPHGAADLKPLYRLALHYRRHKLPESAEQALRGVLRLDPTLQEARELLAALAAERRKAEPEALARILEEDRAFLGSTRREPAPLDKLPDLPELPELPSLMSVEVEPMELPSTPRPLAASEIETSTVQMYLPEEAPTRPRDSGPLDPATLEPGDVIAERYVVDRLLGRGGMGVVLRVTDTMLEEDVALKIIRKPGGSTGDVARFKEEMKICRRLVHPGIVRVFEFGSWRENHFLTMELLEGEDMERMLARADGPLPLLDVMPLLLQACDGLGAAHRQGIAHRDIKPPNLFVVDGGKTCKVMDFGIAKASGVDVSLTATGTLVGSPAYLAPERLRGDADAGAPADLYALGVVMYQLFCGRLPFEAKELPALFMQHLNETPMPPSAHNPMLPDSLSAIVLRCLAKDPADRHPSCRALRRELEAAWGDALRVS